MWFPTSSGRGERLSAAALARGWPLFVVLWMLIVAPLQAMELRLLDPSISDPAPARVLSGELAEHFSERLPPASSLDPVRQPRWMQLRIDPAASRAQRLLVIGRLPMRQLDVYLPDGAGGYDRARRSFFAPDEHSFSPSAFLFELPPALDAGGLVYLRIDHGGRLFLTVQVTAPDAFFRSERNFLVAITAGFTTLGAMLLVNLVFLLALRERLYAYYVAFLAAQMAWVLFATGLGFAVPGIGRLGAYPGSLSGTLITLANALMLQFARHFAELPSRHPVLDRVMQALMVAFMALSLGFLLPVDFPNRWIGYVASTIFALLPIVLTAVLWRAWRAGSRPAGLFLLAWLPLGGFGAYRTLISFGSATPSLLTLYAPLFAVAIESVVLSVALAWRMLELRIQRDRAQYLADYDALTGSRARRSGEQRLQALFAECTAYGRALSLAFIDLDHLKTINDVHGHAAGDACLRALAARVHEVVGERGELVRWGGDEFLLLLPDASPARASQIADAICTTVRQRPVRCGEAELTLAISAGVASALLEDRGVQTLIERADRALYEAKRQGRDRFVTAAPFSGSRTELA